MSDGDQSWMEQSQATWNERAPWWNEIADAYAAAPDRAQDLARTATALGLESGSALLDAGCGSGQFAVAFARMGFAVTAVDLSPLMLDYGRRHARQAGVTVTWREGDLAHLNDPDASYGAVHARLSLHFAPDIPAALAAFRRVLRPGGRLYASLPGVLSPIYGNAWQRHLDPSRRANNYATPGDLAPLLEHEGWQVIDQWGDFGPTPDGEPNPLASDLLPSLPLPLQRAAATTWAFIATPAGSASLHPRLEALGPNKA